MKKYNLTLWQWIDLYLFIWPMWLFYIEEDDKKPKRKSWHEVKKGMEKHVHNYTVDEPKFYKGKVYEFWRCDHEGCYFVSPHKGPDKFQTQ